MCIFNRCLDCAGPHQVSFRPSARNVPLQATMTVTDGMCLQQKLDTDLHMLRTVVCFFCRAWLL